MTVWVSLGSGGDIRPQDENPTGTDRRWELVSVHIKGDCVPGQDVAGVISKPSVDGDD
jgi:hypothetical protein